MQYYPLNPPQYLLTLLPLLGGGDSGKEQLVLSFFCIAPSVAGKEQSEIADAVEKSWNRVVEENDALRLCFTKSPFRKKQFVTDFEYRKIERVEFPGTYEALKAQAIKEYHYIPFCSNPMWRAKSYLLEDGRVATLFTISHLLFDGYSMSLTIKQMSEAFAAYLDGQEPPLKKRPSFIQMLESALDYRKSEDYKADFSYWWKKFNTRKKYRIPGGRASSKMRSAETSFELDGEIYEQATALAADLGVSLPFLFMSVAALTTYRKTGSVDFALHSVVHGRRKFTEKQTIGCQMNTLPIFFNFADKSDMSVKAFIEDGYVNFLEAMRHSRLPGSKFIPISLKESVRNGFNFTPAWFYLSSMDYADVSEKSAVSFDVLPYVFQSFLLYLTFLHFPGKKIRFELSYQEAKYTPEKIDGMLREGMEMLEFVLEDSNRTIGELSRLAQG